MRSFKEWLFLENIRGEYWIDENGYATFADGDIGDSNHESVVLETIRKQIIEAAERNLGIRNKYGRFYSDSEYMDWEEFLGVLGEAYLKRLLANKTPREQNYLTRLYDEDPDRIIRGALVSLGVKRGEWEVANGQGDARDYAMERWGWKVYREGNVNTWRFTKKDLSAIIEGLHSIVSESGLSEKAANRYRFTIEVMSTGRAFTMTLPQMEAALNKQNTTSLYDMRRADPWYDYVKKQADLQVRQGEIDKMHPAYRPTGENPFGRKGVNPFGDSVIGRDIE